MAQVVVGDSEFTEQPQEKRKQQGEGWVTIRTWKGPRASVDAFVNGTVANLDPKPQSIDVVYGTPAVVRATIMDDDENSLIGGGGGDPLTEAEEEAVWELIPMQLDKALATHPAFVEYNGAASVQVVELIEKALREGKAYETDWDDTWGTQNMNDYRNLRSKGVDSWRTWTWTIRKTLSIGKAVDLQAEEANTQKIVDYAEIGIPDDVKWAQPTYRKYDGVAAAPQLINEWMAMPPTIRWVNRKYEVSREWLGAVKWYQILYEGGSALSTDAGN